MRYYAGFFIGFVSGVAGMIVFVRNADKILRWAAK